MDTRLLKDLNAERAARRAVVVVTDLASGRQRLVREAEARADVLSEPLALALRTGKSAMARGEDGETFLNVHVPPARILVIGAVHISQALAPMARLSGFDVEIVDPRTAFATPERFPEVTLTAEWPEDVLKARPLDAYTALVAVTHDPKIDDLPLAAALAAGCFYVGALGSRKTHAARVVRLTEGGTDPDLVSRIESPVGLDIGAATPPEIAVAVLASVIRSLRKRGLPGWAAGGVRFGPILAREAEGAVLAHALKLPGGRLPKGTRLSIDDVRRMTDAGIAEIVAAVLDADDLGEDEAASRIGASCGSATVEVGPAGTGRVNFFARASGLFVPDRAIVDGLNAIDPGITLATLAAFAPVEVGRMVATVKIIPLAVSGASVAEAVALLAGRPAFTVAPYRARRIALIQTELPGLKRSVLDKTRTALEARLAPSGSTIVEELRCAHDTDALAVRLAGLGEADLAIVFGASAVIDAGDVIPAAVVAGGGQVLHLGMPVDPGNLLLLGEIDGRPVLGAPGCARSPKENGFDWILNRLLADLAVTGEDIRTMGVGGLLMEIASRPQPRERIPAPPNAHKVSPPVIDAVILAAGRSSRMGGPHKLLATFDGVPLVRRSAMTALASRARRVRVVTGHGREEIAAALTGLDVEIVENPAFAQGLSTSLVAGLSACVAAGAAGALVMLADQPFLSADDLDRLISAFVPEARGAIVVATDRGRRGNPVVLSARLAPEIARLEGDVGAKTVIAAHPDAVVEVEIGEAAAVDVDTPEALRRAGGVLAETPHFAN